MTAGSVLVYTDFIFHDGGVSSKKLLVILNNPQANEKYIVVPTTSKQHQRSKTPGCHSDQNYYYIIKGQDKFDSETWIVFHDYYELGQEELFNGIDDNKIIELFDLEATLWKAIKNCILKSVDLPGDFELMIKRE
jgi:uncharacterized protein YifN (PemK superfamily)